MKSYWDEVDDPSYPDFLQRALIGYVFKVLHPLTDEEVVELTNFYRLLWTIGEKPKVYGSIIKVLGAIKHKKIEIERQRLELEIKKLDEI